MAETQVYQGKVWKTKMGEKLQQAYEELVIIDKKNIEEQVNISTISIIAPVVKFILKIKTHLKTPKKNLKNLDYHLAEHCNLNCKNCDHFSPIAKPCLAKIEDFERDIKRFAQISRQKLYKLNLLGGEPLLNPQIIDFMRIARENLPKTKIRIITNGILLNEQKEDFWHACNKYDIKIVVTKYPIKLDFEKIKNTAKKHNVKFKFYGETGGVTKTSYHLPLDLKGQQNISENFANCFHANRCVMLKNGKIYPCTVAPNIEHFNKFFGYEIPLTDQDGIDIHTTEDIKEVLKFLAKPIPFCKYCNVKCRTFGHEWEISEKKEEEWRIKNA